MQEELTKIQSEVGTERYNRGKFKEAVELQVVALREYRDSIAGMLRHYGCDLGLSAEIPLLPTIDPQSDEHRSGREALVES